MTGRPVPFRLTNSADPIGFPRAAPRWDGCKPCKTRPAAMVINVDELSGLVDALVPFIRHMLREHGAFLPLGAIVKSGEVVITPAGLDSPDASVEERVDKVKAALRRHASGAACAAVAYCVDVKLSDLRNGETTDAVHLAFEHRSGEALDVVFPYKKIGDDVEFARPMVRIAACGFFAVTPVPSVN